MRKCVLVSVVSIMAATLLGGISPATAAPGTAAAAALAGGPAPFATPDRHLNQKIDWKPCFPQGTPPGLPAGAERLECGSFSTPRNWHNPDEKIDVVIAVSRLRPASGEPKGSVLTNPGGPGAPGRMLELSFLAVNRQKLLNNLEIVGIDVRGTGDSSNVTCGDLTDPQYDYRDRRPQNLDLLIDFNRLRAQSCQVKSGELGRFVTTEQTVADLDLLRHLLGREKISWVGYSAGTWMGAYYATYFPTRVDKFVLDSNTDFTADWQQILARSLGTAFERRFRIDFGPWAARHETLYHLGTTSDTVFANYQRLRAKVAERTLTVTGTSVNGVVLDNLVIGAMYNKILFPELAEIMVGLRTRAEQPSNEAARAGMQQYAARIHSAVAARGGLLGTTDAGTGTLFTIACNDTPWLGDRDSVIAESQQLGGIDAVRGWSVPFLLSPCVFWDRPPVTPHIPTGAGVPPVLMVQSVRDPATPLEGARRAHAGFAGSRLLTVTEEGDHGIYGSFTPNDCVNNAVEAFLVDGTLPANDFSCTGTPLPDPTKPAGQGGTNTASTPAEQVAQYRKITGPLPR